jgi:hypothetical protein
MVVDGHRRGDSGDDALLRARGRGLRLNQPRLEQFRLSGAWGRRGIQDTDAPRHGPTASRTGQHRLGPDRFHEVESDLEEILETRLTDAVTDSGTPPAHGATTPGTQDFHALDPACRGQAAAAGPAFHRVTG